MPSAAGRRRLASCWWSIGYRAVMLTLGAIVSLSTLVYSVARWDRPGQPFHSLFQFLTMGLNGAFLTGDLFNLFVFFEVLLAASYGLLAARRRRGAREALLALHRRQSACLAAVPHRRGADLRHGRHAQHGGPRGPGGRIAPSDRALLDAGAAVLGIAFLIKAGSWPLNFWLPGAYSVALAPVAACFAMMTKVGFYAVLRIGTLMQEYETLGAALFYIGLATLLGATVGLLAAKHLARSVAYSLLVSMGILLASLGLRIEALTAPILFYLIVSVLTTCAFFMLTGMTDRARVNSPPESDEDREPTEEVEPAYKAYGIKEPSVHTEWRRRRRRDPGDHGLPGHGVRVLRAPGERPAAVAWIPGKVHLVVHGRAFRVGRRRADHDLGVLCRRRGVGPRKCGRVEPHRHAPLLEHRCAHATALAAVGGNARCRNDLCCASDSPSLPIRSRGISTRRRARFINPTPTSAPSCRMRPNANRPEPAPMRRITGGAISPVLVLALVVAWLLLNQTLDSAQIVLGAVLATVLAWAASTLRPLHARVSAWTWRRC